MSDSNGHVYENATCEIEFKWFENILNTLHFQFSSMRGKSKSTYTKKTPVKRTIEMGVEQIRFLKTLFHLSEFPTKEGFPLP